MDVFVAFVWVYLIIFTSLIKISWHKIAIINKCEYRLDIYEMSKISASHTNEPMYTNVNLL